MRLIVGLGNPGAKYARNRHNAGFLALDRIAEDHGFGPWRSRFQGLLSEGRLGSGKIYLLKPETFMNRSGQSVGEASRYFGIEVDEITVFHDELDLAPGKVRVKKGGGHAGHNGLRSLHDHIGDAYQRVRIGIGHPGHKDRVAPYVLSDFAKSEREIIEEVMRGISDGTASLVSGDSSKFMNAIARRVAPPRPSTGTANPNAEKLEPAAPDPPPQEDKRNALQRLADRFR